MTNFPTEQEAGPLAAPAQAEARQYLRLALREDMVAVAIAAVREILEVGRLTALPGTPDFVRGVLNLRGAVVPVIDIAARFGQAGCKVGRRTCIVVADVRSTEDDRLHTLGILVDAVYEVFDLPADALEPVPVLGNAVPAEFLAGVARLRGQPVPVLDLAVALAPAALAELIVQPA